MADTFEKILVKDDKIGCLTNKVKYAVNKGGQNITAMPFKAISATTSAHVYNITVPSLETVISREVLWQSTVTLKITGNGNKPPGQFLVNYGVTDALAPFPLHSLVTNMTTTINNNTVSMNVQDTLPTLLRLIDAEELAKYECMTPTGLDYLQDYRDGIDLLDYQVDVVGTSGTDARPVIFTVTQDAQGKETAPSAITTVATAFSGTRAQSFVSYENNSLAYDQRRPAGTTWYHKPRGSWVLQELYALDGATKRKPKVTDTTVYATYKVTEPIMMSPFVFGHPEGKQGFYGIQTMNFQMNINSNASRAWRSARFVRSDNLIFDKTATVEKFGESQLIFTFITPHASDMLEPRNVVPYYELPIYRSTNLNVGLIGLSNNGDMNADGSFALGASGDIQSSNIQLNCVPDKLIIFARKTVGTLTCGDTDSFLTINTVSINWNNQAGLLSSFTTEQLYRASIASGLNNLTWEEFQGVTTSVAGGLSGISEPRQWLCGVGARSLVDVNGNVTDGYPGCKLIPTTGSILVLNFADVLQLTEEYYAPGSLGSFNLQMKLNVRNNTKTALGPSDYELIIIPMNTGVFVNEKGTSSTFIALLTKEDVIQASSQEPYTNFEVKRMVGGSFLSGLKSSLGWLTSKLPFVKNALGSINHPYAQKGHDVLHALGYGKNGNNKLADRLM
jgi:hypothetical protein